MVQILRKTYCCDLLTREDLPTSISVLQML